MSIHDDWWEQLLPWQTSDLFDFTGAISSMWDALAPYDADPDNEVVAWQALLDVDIAPFAGLPWLAQCVGDRVPVGLTEDQARDWIRNSPNWIRGTPQGIVSAIRRVLTGPSVVQFAERQRLDGTPDADCIAIITYVSQTPSVEAVKHALRRNCPGDIVWEYAVIDHATWALVEAGMSSWQQLETTYGPTWGNVSGAQPGFNVWA